MLHKQGLVKMPHPLEATEPREGNQRPISPISLWFHSGLSGSPELQMPQISGIPSLKERDKDRETKISNLRQPQNLYPTKRSISPSSIPAYFVCIRKQRRGETRHCSLCPRRHSCPTPLHLSFSVRAAPTTVPRLL